MNFHMEIKQNFISSERMFQISSDILVNSHQDNKLKIAKEKSTVLKGFFYKNDGRIKLNIPFPNITYICKLLN